MTNREGCIMQKKVEHAWGMLIGLAVGDALGAPLEFQEARDPDNYITKYHSGGIWDVPER
jgi:ADP-ribosylglycohydrolase